MVKNEYKVRHYVMHKATNWVWYIVKRRGLFNTHFYLKAINHSAPNYWASETNLNEFFIKLDKTSMDLLYGKK